MMKHTFLLASLFMAVTLLSQTPSMVKDIDPNGNGFPQYLTVFNNKMFFSANDGTNGEELWVSEGTNNSTQLFKDINPNYDAEPYFLTVIGSTMFFSADDGTNGREVWITDGTSIGTNMLKDINPNGSANPFGFAALGNGTVVFAAMDDSHGLEPWITDGTSAGTVLLKDINTSLTGAMSNPGGFKLFNGEIYFKADNGVDGSELWKTDGTGAGTVMVANINPSSGAIFHPIFFEYNNELYFIADDGTYGFELWKTDGTGAGTVLVKDINTGGSSTPNYFTIYNNELYFVAESDISGRELWKSDGTSTGTTLVKDIAAGTLNSNPYSLTVYNGLLYFKADDQDQGQQNGELWSSDGTTSGTGIHYNFSNNAPGGIPSTLTVAGNSLLMKANDDVLGMQLYIQNGQNTPQLITPPSGANGGLQITDEFLFYAGSIYFGADYLVADGQELWKYDGIASVQQYHDNNMIVYPNPFEESITIQDIEGVKEITVFNMVGMQVLHKSTTGNTVDMSILDRGAYIMQVRNGSIEKTVKLIKN